MRYGSSIKFISTIGQSNQRTQLIQCRTQVVTPTYTRLQVQPLHRASVLLRLHDSFPGGTEIVHLHPHAALSQRHQPSFGANCADIGTGQIILLVDELIQVDVIAD